MVFIPSKIQISLRIKKVLNYKLEMEGNKNYFDNKSCDFNRQSSSYVDGIHIGI